MRLLTDPVLRDRLLHMRRIAASADPAEHAAPRRGAALAPAPRSPRPALAAADRQRVDAARRPGRHRRLGARQGFASVTELATGDETAHRRRPASWPSRPSTTAAAATRSAPRPRRSASSSRAASGASTSRATPTCSTRWASSGALDLALVPIWGWGPRLGPGHLDPERAAEALTLLRPRVAVPIHWGTLFPRGQRDRSRRLTDPPHEFAREAARVAPEVDVRILSPGDSLDL